jgi:KDO2-lipid IV(A) lauroyltransferase
MRLFFQYTSYLFFLLWVGFLWLLPWKILYLLSDTIALLLQKGIKYRSSVIKENLEKCQLGENLQLDSIESAFYKTLVKNLLETIKGYTTRPDLLKKRYQVSNPEILDPYFEKNQSVLLVSSHYNNWEWGIQTFNASFKHQIYGIYQYVSNPFIHQFLMKTRTRGGMKLIAYDQAIKQITQLPAPGAVMILADQSPSNIDKSVWSLFLGRKTPFVHSLEALRVKAPYPMFYYEVKYIVDGQYEVEILPLSLNPSAETPGNITRKYAAMLEQTIRKAPAYWLWSHKRWKRVNPELEQSVIIPE